MAYTKALSTDRVGLNALPCFFGFQAFTLMMALRELINKTKEKHLTSYPVINHFFVCQNESLLIKGSYPQFTDCFINTALVWIPCGLLWLALVPYIIVIRSYRDCPPIATGKLNATKTFLNLVLAGLSIAMLVHHLDDDEHFFPAVYVSDGLRIGTFLLCLVLVQLERAHGFINSYVMFFFWLFTSIASVIPFYTNLEEEVFDSDQTEFYLFTAYFAIVILQFFLCCFADTGSQYKSIHDTQRIHPEQLASISNRIIFWWVNKLIIRGYKRDLKEEDYDDLPDHDLSSYQVPRFEAAWRKEEQRCDRVNHTSRLQKPSSVHKMAGFEASFHTVAEKAKLLPDDETKGGNKKEDNQFQQPSLIRVVMSTYGLEVVFLQIIKTGLDLMRFATPKIMEAMLDFVTTHQKPGAEVPPEWRGYLLACSFFVINSFTSLLSNIVTIRNRRIGMHVRSSTTAAIYKKALTIGNDGRKESTLGEIVNLMSVDTQRLASVVEYVYIILSAPCQVVLALYMLFDQIGVAVFAGLAVLVIVLPINALCSLKLRKFSKEQMVIKDKRMRHTTEVLNGMKVLKLYAWEEAFANIVQNYRRAEMYVLFRQELIIAFITLLFRLMPYFIQVASFGVFIAIDDYLDPSKAFVSINLFNNLSTAFGTIPFVIPFLVQAQVSVKRVEKFLRQPDVDPDVIIRDPTLEDAVSIENGTFTWDRTLPLPTLRNINVHIKPGSLVAVVGAVGMGKSSLISSMLGEMIKLKGTVKVKSKVAYVPQEAWLQNTTLKNNILFGSPYQSTAYHKVIDACALKTDLEILPGGDLTEIGEKGINISGGQKQRVSLARAVYNRADIFLFDDPLSAVDSHVGKHIFNHVMGHKSILRNKTRILVTHGIHWLPQVDTILVMANGRITEMGTYEELLEHEGDFATLIQEHLMKEEGEKVTEGGETDTTELDPELLEMRNKVLQRLESLKSASSADETHSLLQSLSLRRRSTFQRSTQSMMASKKSTTVKAGQTLVEEEKMEKGTVDRKVYADYISAVGVKIISACILLFVVYSGVMFYSRIWLQQWTDDDYLANVSLKDTDKYGDKNTKYLVVYALLGVAQGVLLFTYSANMLIRTVVASKLLHNKLLDNIMKAPMSFFDTTPIGRIVNRFSRDIDTLDNVLPNSFTYCIINVGNVLVSIITSAYSTPILLAVVGPVIILYIIAQRMYMPASRQTKRFDSTTRSPIYVHFSESLSGVTSIRAYQAQERSIETSKQGVDHNFKFSLAQISTQAWLQIRLEFLGNLVVLAAAMFSVMDDTLSPGLAGLSITYSAQVTTSMNVLIQGLTRLETEIVSVERIVEYTKVQTEKPWHNPNTKPPPDWPEEGHVKLQDLELRYRPGLDLVLRGVSCNIKGGQKIGIVGRTGAGKSSLTVALFRLVEAASGKILIDNRVIADLGLHDLRSQITILPQEPVIFSGNIRTNLDPSHQHNDMEIWDAVGQAHLKDFVQGLAGQLDYECGENGQNLSVGQRQLLCLARTLLRKTKILVLDEATAAVDVETDKLIQNTIRTEFKDCTVLTIAHRLNTILDYDKVIVMDKGQIKEMDSPDALLANRNSVFFSMAKDANLVH